MLFRSVSTVAAPQGNYSLVVNSNSSVGGSFGLSVVAGTGANDNAFKITNKALTSALFTVRGDGQTTISGSLITTGSVLFTGLSTSSTTLTNVLMISSSGQLFYTASSALSTTAPTPTFIATGSVTASVNVGTGNVFTLISGSTPTTLLTVSSSGNVGIGISQDNRHTISGSISVITGNSSNNSNTIYALEIGRAHV